MTTMTHAHFPPLSAEQQAASTHLQQHIINEIQRQNGAIPFIDFMNLALYAPKVGYYTGGAHKIGQSGDFITAPTLTPLFAQTLATQLIELLPQTAGYLYEFGAGTGALAADLLNALSEHPSFHQYIIIELSAELAQRQQQHIAQHAPKMLNKVSWQHTLPENFDGIIIGNEVLDAMPIERICLQPNGALERVYVGYENQQFTYKNQALTDKNLFQAALNYFPKAHDIDAPYTSELHPTQYAFINTLAQKLTRGAMLFIDYGFDQHEYYHPQRQDGTLIGHHAHHSIHNPFFRLGLTDLTAHVNFSDIAAAACDKNALDLIGYTTQANFLFNLGLLENLANAHNQTDTTDYVQAAHAIQILTAPHEMGELFKVIAFGKNINIDWQGFARGCICHKL